MNIVERLVKILFYIDTYIDDKTIIDFFNGMNNKTKEKFLKLLKIRVDEIGFKKYYLNDTLEILIGLTENSI